MRKIVVEITSTIEIDVEEWALEYGLSSENNLDKKEVERLVREDLVEYYNAQTVLDDFMPRVFSQHPATAIKVRVDRGSNSILTTAGS